MFLIVIFNNKTGYPKGAVQQMEVKIATLYNTMHVNLYDRPKFGAEAMDLNMATGSLCTVVRHCLHFKIYICFDSFCHMFFPFCFRSESSSLPNLAGLGKVSHVQSDKHSKLFLNIF